MPHAFQGAIMASKCQELICDSAMRTHGPEEGVTRLLRFWSADVRGLFGVGARGHSKEWFTWTKAATQHFNISFCLK